MTNEPRVFIDADVLIAGSASTSGASHIIIQLSGLTLIHGIINEQVQDESERNLKNKLPQALPLFRELFDEALTVVGPPSTEQIEVCSEHADSKDVPILASAVEEDCEFLVTFNTRDYDPAEGMIHVVPPGTLLEYIRERLATLGRES